MGKYQTMGLSIFVLAMVVIFSGSPWAASGEGIFARFELVPITGRFVVTKDNLNVRAQPRTNGKKLSKLFKREKVQVIGKAKGKEWFAVQKEGKDIGFVYAPVLIRIIDGRLEKDILGKVKGADGLTCNYSIRFESETDFEGEIMTVADYWVAFNCNHKGKEIDFTALMFLTEMPYTPSKKSTYQIGLEIAEVGASYDKALSSTIMYNLKKKTVHFDSVTPQEFKALAPLKSQSVEDVPSALVAAIKIAFSSWNKRFIDEIRKN